MRLYKYTLNTGTATQTLDLPRGAEFLSFAFQQGQPRVWYRVHTSVNRPMESVGLRLCFTGEAVDENWMHRGTLQEGYLVHHLFENRFRVPCVERVPAPE